MKRTDFLRWYLPLILWAATILILTSLPTIEPPDLGFEAEDKLAHCGVYFILGILFGRALAKGYVLQRIHFVILIGVALSFAALDEVHQLFIPGRYGDIYDFFADSIGILGSILTFWFIRKFSVKDK